MILFNFSEDTPAKKCKLTNEKAEEDLIKPSEQIISSVASCSKTKDNISSTTNLVEKSVDEVRADSPNKKQLSESVIEDNNEKSNNNNSNTISTSSNNNSNNSELEPVVQNKSKTNSPDCSSTDNGDGSIDGASTSTDSVQNNNKTPNGPKHNLKLLETTINELIVIIDNKS